MVWYRFGFISRHQKYGRSTSSSTHLGQQTQSFSYVAGYDENISMHDVVRHVAISIASREQNVFTATYELVNGWEWSDESRVRHYTSIVILDVKTFVLPEVVECPQLKLFSMHAEKNSFFAIPHNLFRSMLQVRVLDLTDMNLLPLPSSIGLLTNLHTLCLYGCVKT
ncbi:hypothetical protein WN944_007405 [Citrus x changshan-huyou]|uniref:Uncharacterized protein n=1 Tax=Citrus x changshan-huyou TaxID=2935761 RepID=A0AAP0QUC8_9ROSI